MLNREDVVEYVKNNPDFKFAPAYGMYIDKSATIIICLDLRGGHSGSWRMTNVKVDEYTGYRYINYHKRRLSARQVLKNAWGPEYDLTPLDRPPCYRDKHNKYYHKEA